MPPRKKTVTLVDVAEKAGVSKATASLVVRGSSVVKKETRGKVIKAMDELGYVYNRTAAYLRSKKTNTVGLIIPDLLNPFFAELTVNIEKELDKKGYIIILANTSEDSAKQDKMIEYMLQQNVDGILICPTKDTNLQKITRVNERNVSMVQISKCYIDLDVDYIGTNNRQGAQVATEKLVADGHRRIAFIGGEKGSSSRIDRIKGYMDILEKYRIPYNPDYIQRADVSKDGGMEIAKFLFSLTEPPTAAVCYNDAVALGFMRGLSTIGVAPGKDFSVIGFDNIIDAKIWQPSLSTVAVSFEELAKEAVAMLFRRMECPSLPFEKKELSMFLYERESTGTPIN